MAIVGLIAMVVLSLQTVPSRAEGSAVTPSPEGTQPAKGINMTFLAQTLNQVFNLNGALPVKMNGKNVHEELKITLRDLMENLTADVYREINEICDRHQSHLTHITNESQVMVETITDTVRRTTNKLGRSLENAVERHHKISQVHLDNLKNHVMSRINQSLEDNQLILQGIQRLQNKSGPSCRSTEHFYTNDPEDCGYCYSFDMVLRTWTEARSYCRSQGGNLVSIETAGENELLKRIILNNKEHPLIKGHISRHQWFGFWTSGSDSHKEGHWMWTSNINPVTITNWEHGQPDNARGNEHYLQIRAKDGLWNDVPDSLRMFSICERVIIC